MSGLLTAAFDLAKQGWAVFPCKADKSPWTANGFKDASTNSEQIIAWADRFEKDGSMIGAAIRAGTVVIDIDPRNGGDKTWSTLSAHYELPPTRKVATRSGGTHLYYAVPEDTKLRSTLGPGIDVKRAGKGYVIVPPSPGYTFASHVDGFASLPPWLLAELEVATVEASASAPSDAKFFKWENGTTYGMSALERELGRLAATRDGGRNEALNKAAFALAQLTAGGELDGDHARAELARVAELIDMPSHEIKGTGDSGWKAGLLEPRQAPEREVASVPAGRSQATDWTFGQKDGPNPLAAPQWSETNWLVDEPPPPFYLHPVIPKNAYVLVYGATEASKSMVWVGLLAQASQRGIRCSVYSLENPAATDRDRLRRLGPDPANFRLTNDMLDLNDPRQLAGVIEREREWKTDLLLIDTYSHAFNSRSEDGNAKAVEFSRRVRAIMAEVGCTVILIDHTGYAQPGEPRDASAKRQAVDVAILMEKDGAWALGQPAKFSMENRKAARFANPFHVRGEIRDGDDRALEIRFTGKKPEWQAGEP